VAALLPDARADADFDQQFMGLHARLMSAGLQKLVPIVKKTNTLLIFVNQIRYKIGSYGNPETTTGGNALLFYAGYRVHVSGGKSKSSRLIDKGTGEVYGHRTNFRVEKNKRSAPFRSAEVDLIYGMGYDTIGEVVDIAIDVGLIEQGGAWFNYKDNKWQGKEKVKLAIQGDPELRQELERQIRAIVSGEAFDTPVEAPAPPEGPQNDEIAENGEIKNDKPARKKRAANVEASVS
jgi:recombination protein RecA